MENSILKKISKFIVESVLKCAVIIFKSHEHIDEYSLMAEAAQSLAHGGARDESDLALGAYPAA